MQRMICQGLLIIALLLVFSMPAAATGTIEQLSCDLNVTAAKSITVTEKMTINFDQETAAFTQKIPLVNNAESFTIRDITATGVLLDVTEGEDSALLTMTPRIGDSFAVKQALTLTYTLDGFRDHDESRDWFYATLIPAIEGYSVTAADIKVTLPTATEDFALLLNGESHPENFDTTCEENILTVRTRKALAAGDSLTLQAQLTGYALGEAPERQYDYRITSYIGKLALDEHRRLAIDEEIVVQVAEGVTVDAIRYGLAMIDPTTGDPLRLDNLSAEGATADFVLDDNQIGWLTLSNDTPFSDATTLHLNYTLIYPDDTETTLDRFEIAAPGYNWFVPIDTYNVTLTLPEKYKNYAVTVGRFGEGNSYAVDHEPRINVADEGEDINYNQRIITVRGENLSERQSVNISLTLPNFTFIRQWNNWEYTIPWLASATILACLALLVIFGHRRQYGEVKPWCAPGNLDPAALTYALHNRCSTRQVASLLLFWIMRGNLKLQTNDHYITFTRGNAVSNGRPQYEQEIFQALWQKSDDGETISLEQLRERWPNLSANLRRHLNAFFNHSEHRLRDPHSQLVGYIAAILGAVPAMALTVATFLAIHGSVNFRAVLPYCLLVLAFSLLLHLWSRFLRMLRRRYGSGSFGALIAISTILLTIIGIAAIMFCALTEVHFAPAFLGVAATYFISFLSALICRPSLYGERIYAEANRFLSELGGETESGDTETNHFWAFLPYVLEMGYMEEWQERYKRTLLTVPADYDNAGRQNSAAAFLSEAEQIHWSLTAGLRPQTHRINAAEMFTRSSSQEVTDPTETLFPDEAPVASVLPKTDTAIYENDQPEIDTETMSLFGEETAPEKICYKLSSVWAKVKIISSIAIVKLDKTWRRLIRRLTAAAHKSTTSQTREGASDEPSTDSASSEMATTGNVAEILPTMDTDTDTDTDTNTNEKTNADAALETSILYENDETANPENQEKAEEARNIHGNDTQH